MKLCCNCKIVKTFEEFYKAQSNKDGLKKQCKSCVRDFYFANKIMFLERQKEYRSTHKEARQTQRRVWNANNPHKRVVYRKTRRLILRQATPSWATDEWEDFLMSEIYLLAKLRTKVTGIVWHVDHIVPLKSSVVCGLHCSANLRTLPAKINLSKGNKFNDNS